jgi:hypothetical protein
METMKIFKLFILNLFLILLFSQCSREQTPVVTEWIDVSTKEGMSVEKVFKTSGKGVGMVSWWAGGYTWQGGYFKIELFDVKKDEPMLQKLYAFGDTLSGNNELPKFKWWHSEEKDRIILESNRVYKMTLTAVNVAQPGAGWGMWLYEIGTPPKRRADPENIELK